MNIPVSTILLLIFVSFGDSSDYGLIRAKLLIKETSELLGSTISLTEKEQKVNDILMTLKIEEYDQGFADPSKFLPSQHFFRSRHQVNKSPVFRFIQMVPKGASLHSHFSSSLSLDNFLNLTHYEDLYGCIDNGTFKMKFFFENTSTDCDWKQLNEWRKSHLEFLKRQLSLNVDNPEDTYKNVDDVWTKFEAIFSTIGPLFRIRTFVRDYIYQVLDEYYKDNVIYMEMRYSPHALFDTNGTTYTIPESMEHILSTIEAFKKNHPDFLGVRFIYTIRRELDNQTVQKKIDLFLQMQKQFPSAIAGLDLIGQEDKGFPLHKFTEQLLKIADKTKFFFHAGETNWFGENLIDAVLLNTSRIGHGYAIFKHPEVLKIVKEKKIAIEVNPLSNQVLKLVEDLRNHVGANLIAGGYPVVVTCDDPGLWGAKGLSYDWYMAFMAMTPREGDLRILKQLALNSLEYSALGEKDKLEALRVLAKKWDGFLDKILEMY